jgi:hypothetical protein
MPGFLGKWGGERAREKNISKIFFSPVSAFARKKKQDSAVQETIHTETITSHPCKAMHLYQIIHVIWRESQSQETGV